MNKSEYFEILQKLNSLTTYSELFPADFRTRFLEDLSSLKNKINEVGNELTQPRAEQPAKPEALVPVGNLINADKGQAPALKKNSPPEAEGKPLVPPPLPSLGAPPLPPLNSPLPSVTKPPPPVFSGKANFNIKKAAASEPEKRVIEPGPPPPVNPVTPVPSPVKPEEEEDLTNFASILESLVPVITDEGKNKISDLSFSIELYKILKMIDNKTNIHELFKHYGHDYKNFLEFFGLFMQLETDRYITFAKTREQLQNHGWIRIGEILSEGKVTSLVNVEKAASYQKTQKNMFIGDALVELKFITQNSLKEGLNIQQWISKVTDSSEYRRMQVAAQLTTSIPPGSKKAAAFFQLGNRTTPDKKSFTNILDFIIPILNDQGQEILNNPEHKELAGRIAIIDGKSSLLNIFEASKSSFNNNKLGFLKFILKLDSQELLQYKNNSSVEERDVWVKYGELLISLGLITETQLQVALSFKLSNEKLKGLFLGETLAELKLIDPETLEECLKIHKWFNETLAKTSYENAFVGAIETVLQDTFNSKVDLGVVKKMPFSTPLSGMICVVFPISGKLNGNVYYILDNSFMNNLSKTLMKSSGRTESDIDSNIITEISNMITNSSMSRLAAMGIPCEASAPRVIMDQEIIIADKKPISVIPLMGSLGRFAVGLEISE
jgi:CheY-specific phosphatase CheX